MKAHSTVHSDTTGHTLTLWAMYTIHCGHLQALNGEAQYVKVLYIHANTPEAHQWLSTSYNGGQGSAQPQY
jgi:hypothetical protein